MKRIRRPLKWKFPVLSLLMVGVTLFAGRPPIAKARTSIASMNTQTQATVAGTSMASRGATLPYVEYQAENAATNGTVIGPDRTFTQLASEASGRKAVQIGRAH